jgi:hypothetical protein
MVFVIHIVTRMITNNRLPPNIHQTATTARSGTPEVRVGVGDSGVERGVGSIDCTDVGVVIAGTLVGVTDAWITGVHRAKVGMGVLVMPVSAMGALEELSAKPLDFRQELSNWLESNPYTLFNA